MGMREAFLQLPRMDVALRVERAPCKLSRDLIIDLPGIDVDNVKYEKVAKKSQALKE